MTAGTNGPVCGNCGERVAPDAVTCSHCGVLLAAYQSTAGSETLSIVTPESPVEPPASTVPTAPTLPAEIPTAQPGLRPTSISPIGDALRRSHHETQAELHREPLLPSPEADDLAAMASGDDDLAAMADGDDDLAAMASGDDELSAMAREGGESFEAAVNAELAGAKVVFAGNKPVIEGAAVEVVEPGEGEPDVIDQPGALSSPADATSSAGSATASDSPAGRSPTASATPTSAAASPPTAPPTTRTQRPSPAERGRSQAQRTTQPPVGNANRASMAQQNQSTGTNPSRVPSAPSWQSIPGGNRQVWPQDKPKPDLSKMVGPLMAIPFLLIVCLILGAGRGVGTFMVVSFITMIVIVFLLVRAAQLAARKTTSLPRDDSRNWQ